MTPPPLITRVLAEIVGTFGFFFAGFAGIAAAIDRPGSIGSAGIAAGFGLGLAMMIFAFGHVSGGHFNPAVSIGLACGRQFPWREVPAYLGAQAVGGVIAGAAAIGIFSDPVKGALVNAPSGGDGQTFALELIGTALFLLVISAVATDARAPWNGVMAPLAIGGFILVAAIVIGPFTGGSFNPARSFAPAVLDGEVGDLWIYLIAPTVGGAIGGAIYWLLRRTPGGPVEGTEIIDEPKVEA